MDELVDKVVMVHPNLTQDPANRQGQTGTITNVVHENDEVFVRFDDNGIGLYSSDALFLLKPASLILESLRSAIYGIDYLDSKDIVGILDVYALQASGQIKEALELAISNETVRIASIVFVDDWIDRGYTDEKDRGQSPNIGR